jgi:hypothetical protein
MEEFYLEAVVSTSNGFFRDLSPPAQFFDGTPDGIALERRAERQSGRGNLDLC